MEPCDWYKSGLVGVIWREVLSAHCGPEKMSLWGGSQEIICQMLCHLYDKNNTVLLFYDLFFKWNKFFCVYYKNMVRLLVRRRYSHLGARAGRGNRVSGTCRHCQRGSYSPVLYRQCYWPRLTLLNYSQHIIWLG